MKLSDIAIRNPVFAWMLMGALIVFGAISFSRMGVSQLPDVDFPVVTVSITLDGAAPEVMEETVVDPIEDAVMNVQGVRNVTSYSRDGSASITIEFELSRDIDAALQEVQSKIDQTRKLLPDDMDPPTITKTNPEDQPIIWLAVSSDTMPLKDLMGYVKDYLKDQFSTVDGVGDLLLGGYVDPNLRVWVKRDALKKYNVSVSDIITSIKEEHSEIPAGSIDTPIKSFNVRTLGEAKTPEEFGQLLVNNRAGQLNQDPFNILRLNKVADIEEGLAEIKRISRFKGNPAVGIGIRKQRGTNSVAVAKAVKARVKELQSKIPKNVKIDVNFDTTKFVEDSVQELNFNLLLSVLLTSLACLFFLGSWSATFNVLLSIPTSIVGSFTVLYFMGFTLNTFTLLGLSLAIGIVVDDAIMVLENIFRHREEGRARMEAAIVGAREISFAAMAATVAIVAIFLPVAFMKGIIGKFFFQFGVTMTCAVLLSLLEALTITPMRCSRFVDMSERTSKIGRWIENLLSKCTTIYYRALTVALNHYWKVIIGSVAFLFISFISVKFVPKEFSPAQDQSAFLIRMTTPIGSSLAYTDGKTKEAEKFLNSRPEVKQVYAAVGGFGTGGDLNSAMMFVTMKDPSDRPKDSKLGHRLSQMEFMDLTRQALLKIPDVKPVIQDLSMRGFTASRGFPVEFTVRGPDWEKLYQYAHEIMDAMEKSGVMNDVDTDYLLGMPEVQITPDRAKAAVHGVSISAIGQTVNAMVGGVKVGQYSKNGHRIDIRVQLPHEESKVEDIKNLTIGNAHGILIPVSQVVNMETKPSLQQIARYNRERAISVFANVVKGHSQEEALAEVNELAAKILPNGYHVEMNGSAQTMKESFQGLVLALVLGLLVSYMVLASQFNSFIDPFTVLMALPFSLSGAFVSLLITQQSLNIYSMIGLILLMGIVKKNSILLVDFTNQVRDSGVDNVKEALMQACPVRLRPILMTSMATIAGAIPPALAIGPGAETRVPMSIAVIGGVMVSTILTLVVVPCVYLVLARFQKRDKFIIEAKQAFSKVDAEEQAGGPKKLHAVHNAVSGNGHIGSELQPGK